MMPTMLEDVFSIPDQSHYPTSQSRLPYRSFGELEKVTRRSVLPDFVARKMELVPLSGQVMIVFCHMCCKALSKRRWKYQWVTGSHHSRSANSFN